MQHGKGKFVYRSGNVYEGEWSNDVPHGKGIFMEGNVVYDIEHDNGTVTFLLCTLSVPRKFDPARRCNVQLAPHSNVPLCVGHVPVAYVRS
jgi:hypothetical protein